MSVVLYVFFLAFVLVGRVEAQPVTIDHDAIRSTRIVTAVRIEEAIVLDGNLDEAAWAQASPAADFYQKLPRNGAPASERTEARFLYDDDNLYVGVTCFDSAIDKLLIKDLREDFDFSTTDLVQIFIDSLHDRRSGFTFVVNPAGARRDSQISISGGANQDWDGVWDAKVSIGPEAWVVEFAIPFKTVRFSGAPSQEWGLNLSRRVMHLSEESNWSPVPIRFSGNQADMAGTLRGLQNVRQGRNLKVKPFVVAGGTQARTGDRTRTTTDLDGGFDLKYSLTPSMTVDATYRTDFAQVEVDQQQVNLTRFNLFFPEKRDFFLENSGNFSFGAGNRTFGATTSNLVPFFSRSIGLGGGGSPIPIVAGSRVSGQAGRNDLGLLVMKTEAVTTSTASTPSNSYFVGRYKRNLLRTSWIGGIFTDRESTKPGDYNRVYGPDVHFQFFQKLELDSYVLRSETPGRSGKNMARNFVTAWRDDEWVVSAEYNAVEPNFNPEVGFVRRANMSQYSGEAAWRPQLRSDAIRNLDFTASVDYFENGAGSIETRTQEATVGVQFENSASFSFNTNQTFDRLLRPFAIRPTVAIPAGEYQYRRYTVTYNTPNNRSVRLTGNTNWGEFWDGRNLSVTAGLNMRPNYHLNVDLSYSRSQVTLPYGSFTTGLVGARVAYGFSPRAFLNAFVQYNADTNQVSSNLRFNFTHHPLSDLYLVYNDRRDTMTGRLLERAVIIKFTNLFTF
ncbi:MAG: DUF5916 domain-containing protein [Vicinamibacterales bacterium]